MLLKLKSICEKATCILMSGMVALALSFPVSLQAFAVDPVSDEDMGNAEAQVADSEAALDSAQLRLDEISAEYDALSAEIDELQAEIDELATQVLEAQQAMLDGRTMLSNTANYEYRSGTISTFLDAVFGSKNWAELTRNIDYMTQIMSHQADEIATQKELKAQFSEVSDKLTAQKDDQEEKLAELNQKREEATRVVEEAASQVAESSDKLESLRKQAEEFIWQSSDTGQDVSDDANTIDRVDVVSPSTPVIPDPQAPEIDGTWLQGVASAYGGSSDPYTPNPGTTATGAICDDNSMGVAVPMSLPNYRSYFGRTVEIQYNGMTVYAVVNDCGYMGGGSRALDLQPGVFKAFGFADCYAWGVRTVSYRFI